MNRSGDTVKESRMEDEQQSGWRMVRGKNKFSGVDENQRKMDSGHNRERGTGVGNTYKDERKRFVSVNVAKKGQELKPDSNQSGMERSRPKSDVKNAKKTVKNRVKKVSKGKEASRKVDKERRKMELELLLREAEKSPKDIFTGKMHCLSCGKSFGSYSALAEHLRKHNGINDEHYQAVQYTERNRGGYHTQSKKGFGTKKLLSMVFDKQNEEKCDFLDENDAENSGKSKRVVVSTGLRLKSGLKTAKKEKGGDGGVPERMSAQEVKELEQAAGLRLKNTGKVKVRKSGSKMATNVRKSVMREKVAAARKLLSALLEQKAQEESKLGIIQGTAELGGSDDQSLNINKQTAKVKGLDNAINAVKGRLGKCVASQRAKLSRRQILMEELFLSEQGKGPLLASEPQDENQSVPSIFGKLELDCIYDELDAMFEDRQQEGLSSSDTESDDAQCEVNTALNSNEPLVVEGNLGTGLAVGCDSSDSGDDQNVLSAWALDAGLLNSGIQFSTLSIANNNVNVPQSHTLPVAETISVQSPERVEVSGYTGGKEIDECKEMPDVCSSSGSDSEGEVDFSDILSNWAASAQLPTFSFQLSTTTDSARKLDTVEDSGTVDNKLAQTLYEASLGNVENDPKMAFSHGGEVSGTSVSILGARNVDSGASTSGRVRSYASALLGKDEAQQPAENSENAEDVDVEKAGMKKKKKKKKRKGPPDALREKGVDQCVGSFACELCGIFCDTQDDFNEHLNGKKHLKRASAVALQSATGQACSSEEKKHKTVEEVDNAVLALLKRLSELQHKSLEKHANQKHKVHRWLTNGMNEVLRSIHRGRSRAVIVAPQVDFPLASAIDEIVTLAKDKGIVVVYALSRKRLGRVYHFRKKMSVVSVIDIQDCHSEFKHFLEVIERFPEVRG